MKQIGNLSVYKLLGYVILGIGAIAFVNASTGRIQANAPVPVPETSSQYSRSRSLPLMKPNSTIKNSSTNTR